MFKSISVENLSHHILLIRLTNAAEKYTFSETLVAELLLLLAQLKSDQTTTAVILTGSEKYFCTGGDLRAMQNPGDGMFGGTPEEIEIKYQKGIQKVIFELRQLPMPTIAAINGAAVGAGLGLALACDMRFAAAGAKLAESFTRIGLIPGDGDAWMLPRLVGYANAAYLTFTSETIQAQQALQIGLINEVCASEDLLPRVVQVAENIAQHPMRAIRETKKLLQDGETQTFADALQAAAKVQSHLHHSEAHRQKLMIK